MGSHSFFTYQIHNNNISTLYYHTIKPSFIYNIAKLNHIAFSNTHTTLANKLFFLTNKPSNTWKSLQQTKNIGPQPYTVLLCFYYHTIDFFNIITYLQLCYWPLHMRSVQNHTNTIATQPFNLEIGKNRQTPFITLPFTSISKGTSSYTLTIF